jgi:hypothetical protein
MPDGSRRLFAEEEVSGDSAVAFLRHAVALPR